MNELSPAPLEEEQPIRSIADLQPIRSIADLIVEHTAAAKELEDRGDLSHLSIPELDALLVEVEGIKSHFFNSLPTDFRQEVINRYQTAHSSNAREIKQEIRNVDTLNKMGSKILDRAEKLSDSLLSPKKESSEKQGQSKKNKK